MLNVKNWGLIVSERITPILVLFQGDFTILAECVGVVIPGFTLCDNIITPMWGDFTQLIPGIVEM